MTHEMATAAERFVASLSSAQQAAVFEMDDDERFRWQYTPGRRSGLSLEDMDGPGQRELAMALLATGLSDEGTRTARQIIGLEPALRALEEQAGRSGSDRRNAEHYWFSVFGDPGAGAGADDRAGNAWAWRVGGHHLCLHFTVRGNGLSVTPLFFGANPARVPSGELEGLRPLAAEEDLARALVRSLDDGLRTRAIVSADAPDDILTTNAVRADIAAVPVGVERSALPVESRKTFDALVDVYLARVRRPHPLDRDGLTFAWAGSTTAGVGHYYAIRGEDTLIEYDNTQNGANHVHTVWRDLRRDWGDDLLADHYRAQH